MRVVVKLFLFTLFFVAIWYVDQTLQVAVNADQARLAVEQVKKHGPDQTTQWGLIVQNVFWVRFVLWTSAVFVAVVACWSDLTRLVKAAGSESKETS